MKGNGAGSRRGGVTLKKKEMLCSYLVPLQICRPKTIMLG